MTPTIDRALWPLIVVRFPPVVTPAEVAAHFDELESIVTTSGASLHALVIDLVSADLQAPAVREHAVTRMRELYPRVRGRVAGVAHVVGSSLTLAAVTGLLWLAPPPHPTLVTRSMQDALDWARRRLAGADADAAS